MILANMRVHKIEEWRLPAKRRNGSHRTPADSRKKEISEWDWEVA
jgi:hypothetical protein